MRVIPIVFDTMEKNSHNQGFRGNFVYTCIPNFEMVFDTYLIATFFIVLFGITKCTCNNCGPRRGYIIVLNSRLLGWLSQWQMDL